MAGLIEVLKALRVSLADFDPVVVTGADCAVLVHELARTEKACAAARVRAAARAADCGAHREGGFRDADEWMGRQSGSSTAAARGALETNAKLKDHEATAEAVAAGDISLPQAAQIVAGADGDPEVEAKLLDLARTSGLQALTDASRKEQLGRIDPAVLAEKQRKAREFRHWVDDLGMVRFRGALAPNVGVGLMNRLDTETDRVRRRAQQTGETLESREAYAADALVNLMSRTGDKPRDQRVDIVVVVDTRKLDFGDSGEGPCHIIGGGPIPVAEARRLATKAFWKVVAHDGVDITKVTHVGRYQPTELRTALMLGAAPEFEGVTCCEDGCGRKYGLEWDHVDPVANDGITSYDNLARRCWPHHRAKTERDRAAGLLNGRPPP